MGVGPEPTRRPNTQRVISSQPQPVLCRNSQETDRDMGGAQLLKRVPRIKFPQRHPKPPPTPTPASASQPKASAAGAKKNFFSKSPTDAAVGGKASLQPKRTPMSEKEMEAILLGGTF